MSTKMTINQAVDVALDCIENWHGQSTGDDIDDFDVHEGVAEECRCDMGKAYRALKRKLERARGQRRD